MCTVVCVFTSIHVKFEEFVTFFVNSNNKDVAISMHLCRQSEVYANHTNQKEQYLNEVEDDFT